jgi:hypothetical protein
MLPRGRTPDTPAVPRRQSTSGLANTHGHSSEHDSDFRVSMGTEAQEKRALKITPPAGIFKFCLQCTRANDDSYTL